MIRLKKVSKYYNTNGIVTLGLRNINLELNRGEIVAIVGESGAGKSTLLNVICGVDTYEDGEIYYNGNETSYFNQNDMDLFRKKHVAFIYQQYNIIDSYSVLENVMLPLVMNGMAFKDAKEKALELITKVGLQDRVENKGIQLSGGEKQRCVIARALALDCEILACDEPTGNLDSETGAQIIELIQEVAKDKLVLIVTHNYEQVENIVTRVIRVSDGEIIEDVKKQSITEEEKKDLDLTCSEVPKSSLFRIALQNLKNTPRKTFFSLSIMIILSFFILFLMMSFCSFQDQRKYTQNPYYVNTFHNRLVVFDKDHKALNLSDFDDIKGEKQINAFYEDIRLSLSYGSNPTKVLNGTFCKTLPQTYEVIVGHTPSEDEDCFILLPSDKLGDTAANIAENIGQPIYYKGQGLSFKISGYGSSKEINEITFIIKKDISTIITQIYTNNVVIKYVAQETEKEISYLFSDVDKPSIYYTGQEEINFDHLLLYFKGIYPHEFVDYNVVYRTSVEETILVVLPRMYEIDEVFELTIYADNPEKVIKKITNMGYVVVQPGKDGASNAIDDVIDFWRILGISILGAIVFIFITYVIDLRIYASKKIDYTVLRSLGFIRKYMARIVETEVLLVGIASSIFSFVIFYLLALLPVGAFKIISYNNVLVSIIYFALMILLSYLIARRFNKKLFKFSVGVSFKGDEVTND